MTTLQVKKSRFYLRNLPEDTSIYLQHTLTFDHPRARMDPSRVYQPIRLFKELDDGLSFPIGLLERVSKVLERDRVGITLPKNESQVPVTYRINGELDPLQVEAVTALVPRKFGVVEMSVGSGKTITMAAMADCYLNAHPNKKVLMIVPKRQLMVQNYREMQQFLPHRDIGMAGDGKRIDGQIIVAISNTVAAASPAVQLMLSTVGCLILDEAHHAATAVSWLNIIKEYFVDAFWALSGKVTFEDRLDTARNEAVFGPPVLAGRNEKRLCNVEVLVYDTESKSWAKTAHPGMKKDGMKAWLMEADGRWKQAAYHDNEIRRGTFLGSRKISAADGTLVYDNAEDRAAVLSKGRNEWVVRSAELLSRKGLVVIAVRRGLHVTMLQRLFKEKGVSVTVVDGKLGGKQQQRVFDDLNAGRIRLVIAQQNCLREGTNIPNLTDLFLICSVKGHQSLEQLKGRVERATGGKTVGRIHIPGDLHNSHLRKTTRAAMAYYRKRKRVTVTVV